MVQPLLGGKPSGTDFSAQFRWQAHAVKLRKVRMQRNKDSAGWVNWERGRWWFLRIVVTMRFVVHPVCAGHLEPALNQCRWCHLHTYTGNLSQDIVQCHIKYRSSCCQKTLVCDIGQCHTNCPGGKFKEPVISSKGIKHCPMPMFRKLNGRPSVQWCKKLQRSDAV